MLYNVNLILNLASKFAQLSEESGSRHELSDQRDKNRKILYSEVEKKLSGIMQEVENTLQENSKVIPEHSTRRATCRISYYGINASNIKAFYPEPSEDSSMMYFIDDNYPVIAVDNIVGFRNGHELTDSRGAAYLTRIRGPKLQPMLDLLPLNKESNYRLVATTTATGDQSTLDHGYKLLITLSRPIKFK